MPRRSAISSITIDRAGRVVIPNSVRRQLRLHPGSRLTIAVEAERLVLQPVDERDAVVEEDGILVATGTLTGEVADHRDLRDQRLRKLGRW